MSYDPYALAFPAASFRLRSEDFVMDGPLPAQAYEYAEWKKARVNIDYHVDVERHYYSVPHRLLRKAVVVRLTTTAVEILYGGQRVRTPD